MPQRLSTIVLGLLILAASWGGQRASGQSPAAAIDAAGRPKRVLLLGQGPDGHPWSTHEYMAGLHILAACLQKVDGVQPIIIQTDDAWADGPALLDAADAVVLFLAEGAKWMQQTPARFEAFGRLAARGGGVVVVHWAMGTREAPPIEGFLSIAGGCHGGPDRKYKVLKTTLRAVGEHPILRGVEAVEVHDEFYYALKFVEPVERITPLAQTEIDGAPQTVAWAWQRPDGGRSAGFSGLHFHRNWKLETYRRLVTQMVAWTIGRPIPRQGFAVDVPAELLRLAPQDTPAGSGK